MVGAITPKVEERTSAQPRTLVCISLCSLELAAESYVCDQRVLYGESVLLEMARTHHIQQPTVWNVRGE
eukprot:652973-Pleurochrysis_carterae.AAC.2